MASKDHKLLFWFAGGISALSVLLEKKARRAELALYVLPRAGDSLWYILVNRHFLPNIKNAEVLPSFPAKYIILLSINPSLLLLPFSHFPFFHFFLDLRLIFFQFRNY